LYYRAYITNVYTRIANPKEYETSTLIEVILYSNVFTIYNNFIINSQLPPTPKSKKKYNIVVRYLENRT
jgi:hypothetical protein